MIYGNLIISIAIASMTIAFSLGVYDLFVDLKKEFISSHFSNIISDLIYIVCILSFLIILVFMTRKSDTTMKYLQKNLNVK